MRLIVLVLVLFSGPLLAQIDLRLTQVTDVTSVVDIKHAGDGSDRLFLVRQFGDIRILKAGTLLETPFMDIRPQITIGQEQGLLSIAFPPDHAASGRFYVYYTDDFGRGTISRFQVQANNRDLADLTSEEVLLTVNQPFPNHNGGRLEFGPDGMLYFGFGDGGSANDPEGNAQNPRTLLGKLIRIDVSTDVDYAIPPDNPFVGDPDVRDEIWALGLRNPWRIAFDRMTGELYIADVGQQEIEEVNRQPAGTGGQNYGWDRFEGNRCFEGDCNQSGLTFPILEYPHSEGCSITGGQVYRGLDYPALQGIYLFGDFCSGTIWGVRSNETQHMVLLSTDLMITTFGEDEVGNVYVAHGGGGTGAKGTGPRGVYLISDGAPVEDSRPIVGQHTGTYVVDGLPDQGFFLTVDENASGPFMFFAWFTFLDGEPFWLVGVEFFSEGDASVVVPVGTRRGPGFLDFSGDSAQAEDFGTMSFTAVSCTQFRVDYEFDDFGAGSLVLDKLTGVKDFACED
ncbi:MAG: PQQ-dependent sugar dehydrogenase [Xanthomonadales bacterium]|nr:PQQ-dependent sugar dehydrogenase [Xanthomonadales bacterium]